MVDTGGSKGEFLAKLIGSRAMPLGAMPQRGIPCPFNLSDQGPAKKIIWCGIWKDQNQYAAYGNEATKFCRSICHYGVRYAADRSMVERAAASHRATAWQRFRFVDRWNALRRWWQ